MSLPELSVRNRVLVNVLMVVILVAGAGIALTLVREMFPESRPDKLAVTVVQPGVQPRDLEKGVTVKIEEAVRDVDGIEKVESTISEGLTTTVLTLFNDVDDVDAVLQQVKNEVDAVEDLPDDVEQVVVRKMEPRLPVISVAIYGEGAEADRKRAARTLRDDLLQLPGVSEVQIEGLREDEISIEVRPGRLLKYNVTFDEVAQAVRQTNLDISGGNLRGSRAITAVRTVGEETEGRALGDIVVRSRPDGSNVLLSHVAHVRDGFVENDVESYYNGRPAMHCVVYKTKSQDAVQISTLVKAYVFGKQGAPFDAHGFRAAAEAPWYWKPVAWTEAGFSWMLPRLTGRPDPMQYYQRSRTRPFRHGLDVGLHTDLARYLEGRLDLMVRNGRNGLLLVLLTLNLFLHWRVAFWAAVGLPVSLLGAFIVMWFAGTTINLLTLFGMIIVLGIVVDDAIVIGENVYRHIENGMPPVRAAVRGAEEVQWPITIAVLTTIAAFAPLFFVEGQIGDFMGQLPIVVIAALGLSLIEALVILPAHLAHVRFRPADEAESNRRLRSAGRARRLFQRIGQFRGRLLHNDLPRLYESLLRRAIAWRYVTLSAGLAALLVSLGLVAGRVVEWVFIQNIDSETLICSLEMPVGAPARSVKEQLGRIGDFATDLPEAKNVQTHVGRQYDVGGAGTTGPRDQPHLGQLIIELHPADVRERRGQRSSEELLTVLRRRSRQLAGVESVTWEAVNGGPGGKDIHVQLTGPDLDDFIPVAERLKTDLTGYTGVYDITDNLEQGKQEIRLRLRGSARPTGITVQDLGRHVRSALYGNEARRLTRNREDVRLMVRYSEPFRENVYNLESMWIPTGPNPQQRGWVPLREVAQLTPAEGYTTLRRSDQQRSLSILGEVDQDVAETSEIVDRIRTTFETRIAPNHPEIDIEFLGSYEEMIKAFSSLKLAFPVALLLVYMLLAGLFHSYAQPLVVMAAIPFGIVGAIVGHWMTGNPMTILSQIGFVALVGILVNDSLILVDFINRRVRDGMPPFEASIEGAKLRLRAILLTTMTTVAGLTPLMFETSFQAAFLIPMAVTLTFGLIFATALTLILVPALNMVFFDVRSLVTGENDSTNSMRPSASWGTVDVDSDAPTAPPH